MSGPTFTVAPIQPGDVPTVARLCADAFGSDRQTEMKGLGKEPFEMEKYTLESLPGLLKNPRVVALKATDHASGDIMGYITWGFRGFPPDQMPVVEGRVRPPGTPPPPADTDSADTNSAKNPAETEDKTGDKAQPQPETDPIKRLEALTSADMNAWIEGVMPEGTRCIYVVGLSVSPAFQGRGVGSALLRFGTDFCDRRGVFAWVHSSEPAWRVYEKAGFRTVRELDVDLDEYAPVPPPNEGHGARWGHYVFRYMKYTGQKT